MLGLKWLAWANATTFACGEISFASRLAVPMTRGLSHGLPLFEARSPLGHSFGRCFGGDVVATFRPRIMRYHILDFLSCCSIGRARSCVRPVLCGGEAAGHNALRGSGPNQKHAFKDALTQTGSPDPRIDLVCITSSCPRQFLQTSNAVVVSWPHLLESLWL